ncbi:SDR family oxidoreductase [Pantoea sp. B65]|uniref:SDR family oxidoreductase n=1 Tax=Pantoea sp. B65 TaxID=2813359 RepID=UPI0039B542C9
MKLQNKNILLTGASGGIGQALAQALAAKGACLWLAGRNASALAALCAQLPHHDRHRVLAMNSYSDDEILSIAAMFSGDSRLDVLINNAGCSRFALFEDQTFGDIRDQIRANVELPLLLTSALCRQFNTNGIILNIGSVLGEIGHPGYSVYSATKAVAHRFSEALGREQPGSGLSVLYIAPRATRTGFNSEMATAMNDSLGNSSDSPEQVAREIVISLERQQKRKRLGFAERLFVKINALVPSVVDRALSKKMAVINRFARQSTTGTIK